MPDDFNWVALAGTPLRVRKDASPTASTYTYIWQRLDSENRVLDEWVVEDGAMDEFKDALADL